jgi:uncharacterized Zn finger protein
MTAPSRTWWGQKFLAALESFTDRRRLQRGRAYDSDHRILSFELNEGLVAATVRGNINPYFGVAREPRYKTRIRLRPIPGKGWQQALDYVGSNAGLVSRLLMNEMPSSIDEAFADMKLPLLPRSRADFALTRCSCPDSENPCKHIAGVYYRLAHRLDSDPFLLFELRGMPRERLLTALAETPLGHSLAPLLRQTDFQPEISESLYTRPVRAEHSPDYQSFWRGPKPLPTMEESSTPAPLTGILARKGGDFPGFWDSRRSFLAALEDIYARVRRRHC